MHSLARKDQILKTAKIGSKRLFHLVTMMTSFPLHMSDAWTRKHKTLTQWWLAVCYTSPALIQHWANLSCSLTGSKYNLLTQCFINVGSPPANRAQHYSSFGSISHFLLGRILHSSRKRVIFGYFPTAYFLTPPSSRTVKVPMLPSKVCRYISM